MRLEDFRLEVAKLTRQQLSVISGVSISTIQRAEEGEIYWQAQASATFRRA